MNKDIKSRNRCIHLYNPKEEGLGKYDANYINAFRKNKRLKENITKIDRGRYVAWFHT